MKFIWFDDSVTEDEIQNMIKNKNKNCFESLSDMINDVLKFTEGLVMEQIIFRPLYCEKEYDFCLVYIAYFYDEEGAKPICYFIQV